VRRITLDTNEFVSALSGGGKALQLLHTAIEGEIQIAVSEPIITETIRVLRGKFDWPPYDLLAARQRLERIGRLVKPSTTLSVTEDEPDNRILECAAESDSEFIVTEDNGLLRLKQHGKAQIVTSAEMLEILQREAGRATE